MNNFFLHNSSVKNLIFILIGTIVTALAMNIFIINAQLLNGGVTGVALILQYLFKIPTGLTVLILNIPLFIMSYFYLGRSFTIMTIIGTLTLSAALVITSFSKELLTIKDPLLLSIYGGVLNGLGTGIVFTNKGSTGGLDIISAIIKKLYGKFDIGMSSFVINTIIVAIGSIFFGLTSALYSLILMYLSSFVVDKVIKGFNKKKLLLIITDKEEEVGFAIMENLKRGVTFLNGEGGYTHKNRKIIYCVISLSQLPKIRDLVRNIDGNSFISILDVSEVQGEGFKKDLSFL